MITVNDPALTDMLLIDELGLWDCFDSKSIEDEKAKIFYEKLSSLIDDDINSAIEWLESDEAREAFFGQGEAQKEIFDALETEWDSILNQSYDSVDELLDEIYKTGKEKGYENIRETLRYTDADRQAIRIAKDYNFHLIRKLDNDLRGTVKNKILKGIISGENPYNLARDLVDASVQQLDGSTFTPRQRATMIAKTETSRMQNTGMLQSYINEGYIEVKILTAEDDNVCATCLEYAFKLNEDEPRVYSEELLKRERVHNIIKLIKGGLFPPFHPNCYMPDTQVFTNHGWKYFYDITEDDKILSLNPETKTTEFLDYVKVIAHENSQGYMYHIHNKWFDTCVTSDHDCFIYQRKEIKGERVKVPEFRKPDELNSESYFLRTIKNDNVPPDYIDINGLKFKASDYAFFMAWYLSEGSILHNHESAKNHAYPIKISQEISINREILENELKRIFNYLGLKVAMGKSYFEIYSKELYDYLEPLGYCHEMYVPNELFSLNQDDLRLFIENYIRGDGHARKSHNDLVTNSYENTIVTSSLNLVNDLSYIILLAGYYPSISLHSPKGTVTKYHNGEYASNHDVYCLRVNRSNFTQFANCTVDKIPYDGMVYCVELPKYHTLWTKRNGKTSWNGNCRCTYLTVWGSKTEPPENPYIINLTPLVKNNFIKDNQDESNTIHSLGNIVKKFRNKIYKNSPEAIADKFNLTYESTLEYHTFKDNLNDCRIVIPKVLCEGENSIISVNGSHGYISLFDIVKAYSLSLDSMKLATKNIVFLNQSSPTEGPLNNALAYHTLDGNDSNIYIFSKSSLWNPSELGLDFQRQLLHEMSHAQDLNPIHGLHLSNEDNLSQFDNFGINSSENAFEANDNQKYEEVIADALSMVVYKNIPDKSTATIKVPRFDENGKHIGYEVIGYDEWHERFNDLALWLEKELNL